MKIVVFDSWKGKFSKPIVEFWESLGHEVLFNPTWEAMEEADLTFFYQSDNGLVTASTEKKPHKGKVFAQCVDIEVWAGQPLGVDWSYVNGVFFMAEHIRDMVLPRLSLPDSVKTALIKPGIDIDRFPLKKTFLSPSPPRKLAYVVGERRIWDVKRLDVCLMMLRDLLDNTDKLWQLHILGSYSTHEQYNDYCKHLIKDLDLEGFIFWYEYQESVSDWLEDKDYFVLPSTKEAFSYATAEAMAKGIKPIIGNWRGAKETWGPFYNKTYTRMLRAIWDGENGVYHPEIYRKYVADHYDQKRYFKELSEFLEVK